MPRQDCQPIRDQIEQLETDIRELEEILPELPPARQPVIKRIIKEMKLKLARKRDELRECEEVAGSGR
jgi:hypothetical protein